jgi:hypothetical protein
MSQMIRRIVVAASLTLALLLVSSAPSHAAQARKPVPAPSLVAQVWSWLEGLMGGFKSTPPPPPRKDVMTTPAPLPPPPEQGPAIDPNGTK